MSKPYFGLEYTVRIPIWNSAGTALVPGIATASMTPVLYIDDVSTNASGAVFSAGGGWYGLTVDDAENSADNVRVHIIVSASAADGFAQWDNSHDVVDAGSASAGTVNTITLRADTRFTKTDGPARYVIDIIEGSGYPDSRLITAYTTTTRVATVADAWTSALPGTTTKYQVRRGIHTNQGFPANFDAMLIPADGRPEVNVIEVASVSASAGSMGLTSAETSTLIFNGVWNFLVGETNTIPNLNTSDFRSMFGMLMSMALNPRIQSSTSVSLFTSSGTLLGSASTSFTSTSARIGRWLND